MKSITDKLFALQDIDYKEFSSKLIPDMEKQKVIGVRTPDIRQLAKQLKGSEEAKEFLQQLPHDYQEENVLHGCLIEQIKDYNLCMEYLEVFLPYVNNWAVCDLMSPKVFGKHKEELLEKIKEWIDSDKIYIIRFAIGMLMRYYLDDDYKTEYSDLVAAVHSEEYYVEMMAAWYYATGLAKQYDAILPYLTDRKLSVSVHNKTIQKAVESRRISPEQKTYLRTLRIKKNNSSTPSAYLTHHLQR